MAAAGLAVVLLLAAGLRFSGLDWDGGQLFHPDERRIMLVVGELHWPRAGEWARVLEAGSPLNPRFFSYGSLPLYLLRLVQGVLGVGVPQLYLPARALSAGFDLLTVALTYALGRRLGGRRTGLLGAAFLALSVLPIQLAHFASVEPLLTLLTATAVYALFGVVRAGSLRAGVLAGVLAGLALATKTSALPLLVTVWAAWALWALGSAHVPRLGRGLAGLTLSTIAAGAAFLAAEPYALIDWFRFGTALVQESAMAQGWDKVPYTRQYVGTLPYLYQLRELALWSLGLPLGLLALAGLAWLTWRGLRQRRPERLLPLAWFWPYFLVVGGFQAKFTRYMAPLIPWLCLMAALLVVELWRLARPRRWARLVVAGLGAAVLLATGLYSLAFTGLYLRPHTWLAASDWIYGHVPEGSTLAVELWDDPLPVTTSQGQQSRYRYRVMDLYAPEGDDKLDRLAAQLEASDYIVLPSQRLYGTLGRLPGQYPLASAYYRLLFAEELGFRLVHVEAEYPRLGPVALVDEPLAGTPLKPPPLLRAFQPAPVVLDLGRADESYSVYDHPRTLIFRKEARLTAGELRVLLQPGR